MNHDKAIALMDALTSREGEEVTILHRARADGGYTGPCAIKCVGAWTDWEPKTFSACCLTHTLELALIDYRKSLIVSEGGCTACGCTEPGVWRPVVRLRFAITTTPEPRPMRIAMLGELLCDAHRDVATIRSLCPPAFLEGIMQTIRSTGLLFTGPIDPDRSELMFVIPGSEDDPACETRTS